MNNMHIELSLSLSTALTSGGLKTLCVLYPGALNGSLVHVTEVGLPTNRTQRIVLLLRLQKPLKSVQVYLRLIHDGLHFFLRV